MEETTVCRPLCAHSHCFLSRTSVLPSLSVSPPSQPPSSSPNSRSKLAETRAVVTFKRGAKQTDPPVPQVDDIGGSRRCCELLRGDSANVEDGLAMTTAEEMTDIAGGVGL